jgi:hypothetical protein
MRARLQVEAPREPLRSFAVVYYPLGLLILTDKAGRVHEHLEVGAQPLANVDCMIHIFRV